MATTVIILGRRCSSASSITHAIITRLGAIRFVMYFRHPGKLRKALTIRHSAGQPIEADIVAQDNQAEHDVEITFPSLFLNNRLRAKIDPDPANLSVIQTVWGVGYRLQAASLETNAMFSTGSLIPMFSPSWWFSKVVPERRLTMILWQESYETLIELWRIGDDGLAGRLNRRVSGSRFVKGSSMRYLPARCCHIL